MSESSPSESPRSPRVIKRYSNRKLYDTAESRYITLEEISEMVKQGVELQILDNKSREDLTSVTLAQIIFEQEKKRHLMPLSVLREIIRAPGETLGGFISRELSPRVASIRDEAGSRLGQLIKREEEAAADLLQTTHRALEEWQRKVDERISGTVGNLSGNLPAMGKDLRALIQRLEQLEKQVQELEAAKKK
ncbi:MAG: transcriptional regulator [Deltaproteobacteria bacterium]|nr:transcriptional regulator [Deltaproteobacteria bacterium]